MTQVIQPNAYSDDPEEVRFQKLQELRAAGIDPYPHSFARSHKNLELQEKYAALESGSETEDRVNVAGRIMAIRNDGMFLDLKDATGKIQVFCHKDSMADEIRARLRLFDIGDIIGATGTIRRTPRGELSVRASDIIMLVKSTLILPEKYHGLTDIEQRYRQRYLDLIMNEESREKLRTRSKIISTIRRFMDEKGALEVETPMLHPIMGGASARPFVTHHNALDSDFYLRVAPELYLKRLVIGGLADSVYEINRCFRNEGISTRHNPEFTSIEGYHLYTDYTDMMSLVEQLAQAVAMEIHGSLQVPYGDQILNFAGPWPRKSMCGIVQEETGLDFMQMETAEEAHTAAKSIGLKLDPKLSWGQVVEAVFAEKAEPKLIQPIHITDFPFEISPLAKSHRSNPRLVERFESYVNTWEIANAFTELNDPEIQRERFEAQVSAREAGDSEAQMLDEDYITALRYGLPPCGGWGMGIDRLVMLMTNSTSIREVLCFPTLKPL